MGGRRPSRVVRSLPLARRPLLSLSLLLYAQPATRQGTRTSTTTTTTAVRTALPLPLLRRRRCLPALVGWTPPPPPAQRPASQQRARKIEEGRGRAVGRCSRNEANGLPARLPSCLRDPDPSSVDRWMGMTPGGWVAGLVAESFFVACPAHESRKKNERNIFCLACCASICPHCAPAAHRHHPLLQVRRYVYHDVVRLGDLEKLIDCSYVQTYTINSAKVIFLKPRPQSRPFKGSGNVCLTCDRILQEPFHFCSLSCKVDHVMTQGGDLSNILQYYGGGGDPADHLACFPRFENLRVDGSDLDDDTDGGGGGQVTPDSTLDDPTAQQQQPHCYGGGGSSDGGRRAEAAAASKRKKGGGGGGGFFPQIVLSLGNRRKGAPHRSPLA